MGDEKRAIMVDGKPSGLVLESCQRMGVGLYEKHILMASCQFSVPGMPFHVALPLKKFFQLSFEIEPYVVLKGEFALKNMKCTTKEYRYHFIGRLEAAPAVPVDPKPKEPPHDRWDLVN